MKRLIATLATVLISLPAFAAHRRNTAAHHAIGRVEYGIASWYGHEFQGRTMACGEPFDEHEMVAAHRTLPLGTRVRVTNLRNGRSVVVRIRDRGPAVPGRLIDLSHAAAKQLGYTGRGLAPVRVRVLTVPGTKVESLKAARLDGHTEAQGPINRTRGSAS